MLTANTCKKGRSKIKLILFKKEGHSQIKLLLFNLLFISFISFSFPFFIFIAALFVNSLCRALDLL